jgi:hypothetical protein
VIEWAFRTLVSLRGARALHPDGAGFEGVLTPAAAEPTGTELFDGPERRVLIRLSHAVGLPEPVPEPFGLAFRATDAYGPGRHQDVLLTTAAAAPVGRHLPLPVAGVCGGLYSSLLPYRIAGGGPADRCQGLRRAGDGAGTAPLRPSRA